MGLIECLKSAPGRIAKVAFGVWLIIYGGTHASMWGLVLMMVGIVPAVTGIAGICLLEELLKAPRAGRAKTGHPREHHA